jgi:transcriptional regulator with XRE-family HTH domain
MSLSGEEKEKIVLDLYYKKGYTYRDLAKELKMSPNQIRDIIKRNEEKNDATANKKKLLSLSSKAYRMFSQGRTNVQVAIKLDIPENQVTQLHSEYWRLQDQNNLESLYIATKGKAGRLWKLYRELVIKRGMSLEEVAKVIDIALHELPDMESRLEQTTRAAAMKEVDLEHLEYHIHTLKEEEEKRKRMITMSYHNYYYVDNRENAAYYPVSTQRSLPYPPSGYPDLTSEFRNDQEKSRKKEEVREVYEGDIAD